MVFTERSRGRLSRPSRSDGEDGFTVVELIVTIAIIAILAALTVPALVRARISANETSAIASLKAINAAQTAYATAAASGGFASDLAVLAALCPEQSTAFISPEFTASPLAKNGYTFALLAGSSGVGPNDCNGTPTRAGYYLTAIPLNVGVSGNRAFATSEAQVIFMEFSGVPPSEAEMRPGGGGTPIQ